MLNRKREETQSLYMAYNEHEIAAIKGLAHAIPEAGIQVPEANFDATRIDSALQCANSYFGFPKDEKIAERQYKKSLFGDNIARY